MPTLFLQDRWRRLDRLTLNAGLRWSSQYLIDDYGRNAQKFSDEWQPRVGFVLQLGRPATLGPMVGIGGFTRLVACLLTNALTVGRRGERSSNYRS